MGVKPGSTQEEIKHAYRELAKKYHPDQYRDTPQYEAALEKMKQINAAYDMLTSKAGAGAGAAGAGASTSGEPLYQHIRNLIAAGDILGAEKLLNDIQDRNAEWYYLMGVVSMRKGWYSQAKTFFDTAVRMDPSNTEYQQAYQAFTQQGQGFGSRTGYGRAGMNKEVCRVCGCVIALQACSCLTNTVTGNNQQQSGGCSPMWLYYPMFCC